VEGNLFLSFLNCCCFTYNLVIQERYTNLKCINVGAWGFMPYGNIYIYMSYITRYVICKPHNHSYNKVISIFFIVVVVVVKLTDTYYYRKGVCSRKFRNVLIR
jgi:hypothetical protein